MFEPSIPWPKILFHGNLTVLKLKHSAAAELKRTLKTEAIIFDIMLHIVFRASASSEAKGNISSKT